MWNLKKKIGIIIDIGNLFSISDYFQNQFPIAYIPKWGSGYSILLYLAERLKVIYWKKVPDSNLAAHQ